MRVLEYPSKGSVFDGIPSPFEVGTTGEVKKGPTVGRRTDLPWVGEATYSRFFRRPTVGRFWGALSPLFMRAGGGGKRGREGSPKKRRAEGAKLLCFVEGDEPLRVEGESVGSAVRRYETSLLGLSLEFVPETLVGDGRRQGER